MKSEKRNLKFVAAAVGLAAALSAMLAWSMGDAESEAVSATAITVHVNGHGGDGIAKKINEMHAKMTGQGWAFAHLSPHSENADTEGAWVTYTKP